MNALSAELTSLIRAMCRDGGDNLRAIAARSGYTHTALSLAMNGKYKGKTDRLEKALSENLAAVHCPHLDERIAVSRCVGHRSGKPPTSSPMALAHWRSCQQCPRNPAVQKEIAEVSHG